MSIFKGVYRKLLALAVLLSVFAPASLAQGTRQVRGVVYDEAGEPFPGVIVISRKHKLAATTDVDGRFLLQAVPSDAVLTVEMISYKTQEIRVADLKEKQELKIYLEPDTQVLEESVVTGIFTRRKDSFTGSAEVVNADKLRDKPKTSRGCPTAMWWSR